MSTGRMLSLAVQNKNILRLATVQALAGVSSVVFYATGATVGNAIAPSPSLTALSITLFVLGTAASILSFGALVRTRDHKTAFRLGIGARMVTGPAAALAIILNSSLLSCLAMMPGDAYAVVVLSFRFVIIDGVVPARRARVLSLVMDGGVTAGIIGPMLVTDTMHLWPARTFTITFLAQTLVAVLAAFLSRGMTSVGPTATSVRRGWLLRETVCQPGFATTVLNGSAAYMVTNSLMTTAPLSMHMYGLPQQVANLGIQWCVTAMHGPGFFTGRLTRRLGTVRMAAAGSLIITTSVAVDLSGLDMYHYWLSLTLLGIG